jgi:hypothetical protein
MMRCAGRVACMGEKINHAEPLGITASKWEWILKLVIKQ